MIRKLQKRFIRIALLAFSLVLIALTLIVNIAYFVSTDNDLSEMLVLIYKNHGMIPHMQPLNNENAPGAENTAAPEAGNTDSVSVVSSSYSTESISASVTSELLFSKSLSDLLLYEIGTDGASGSNAGTNSNENNTPAAPSPSVSADPSANGEGASESSPDQSGASSGNTDPASGNSSEDSAAGTDNASNTDNNMNAGSAGSDYNTDSQSGTETVQPESADGRTETQNTAEPSPAANAAEGSASPADGTMTVPDGSDDHFGGTPPDGSLDDFGERRDKPFSQFNEETALSTRYFILYLDADGKVTGAFLERIAAVTEEDTEEYAQIACQKADGFGYYGNYKYYVVPQEDGSYTAIFLDCYQEMRSVTLIRLWSIIAAIVCIIAVYLLVRVFSKHAIEPTIKAAEQQKQFITDATHELKTPISVINTSLSVLEMEVGKQKWIDKSMAQTDKMINLINSLVTLSRMDEEVPRLEFSEFDLSSAVSDIAESFRDAAEADNHPMSSDIIPGIMYRGDESALRQLISILLDNALKYALPGGFISISLKKEHHSIILKQSNPCTPIDDEDLKKLFDRFYRPDKSRTSSTGGSGIGLSIARGITEAHKGSITASCPEEGVIEFIVTLKSNI